MKARASEGSGPTGCMYTGYSCLHLNGAKGGLGPAAPASYIVLHCDRSTARAHLWRSVSSCMAADTAATLPVLPPRGTSFATHRLTVLEACSGCPLASLFLEGAVPVSSVVAEAVQACCPQLSTLHLAHRTLNRRADAPPQGQAAADYECGCVQLLTLCGPRLTELRLLGVQHWLALPYRALRRCTALTTLAVDAGLYERFLGKTEPYLGTSADAVRCIASPAGMQHRPCTNTHARADA